jgi:hypothetical protein
MKHNKSNKKPILLPMPKGIIMPSEDKKIEFTDIYGETFKGMFIADENIFFIGYGLTGDFRFSHSVHNWKYIKC